MIAQEAEGEGARAALLAGACLRHDNHAIENPGACPTVMTAAHGEARANCEKKESANGNVQRVDRTGANGRSLFSPGRTPLP